ncbi:Rep [Bat associated cyclovirus 17]|uniref:Rep n=1 Tax=Bat associated cyclovirus 17 TaxID=2911956 RepID=UPI002481E756|nr:Rep [Bat associated cyclovirus 17]UJO02083.1 Rep [Bat associated cyclovirus 17]
MSTRNVISTSNPTVKRICFTLNNYGPEDEERIQQHAGDYLYAIYGREQAPTTGTPHLQGIHYSRTSAFGLFINFHRKRRFNAVKGMLGQSVHIEIAKGTDKDNQRYCSKGGSIWEHGEPSKQGERTDLKKVVDTIRQSTALAEVISAHPESYIRYHRGIEKLFGYIGSGAKRAWNTVTWVFYGESGCGKSRAAAEITKEAYYKTRGEWWDNYKGQEDVILDDYYGWLRLDEFLRVTDRYPLQVPIKGGFVEFVAKRIVITSNKEPIEWYSEETLQGELKNAFLRRLDIIYKCTHESFEKIK